MQRDWNTWPLPSRHEDEHSTKEIEHRFTGLEASSEQSKAEISGLHEIAERHGQKLSTHEKAILGLLIGMATLLQDKFPKLAAMLLKGQI
jgi:ribosomal protein S12 methylthiotransferase accessory factor YcaO